MLCADITIAIEASAERVYEALTKGGELVKWWPNEAASDLSTNEPYSMTFKYEDGEQVRTGTCISAVPAQNVALTGPEGKNSVVEFLLVPDRTPSCTLRLLHTGFGNSADEKRACEVWASVWPGLLDKLRDYVETGNVNQAPTGPIPDDPAATSTLSRDTVNTSADDD